MHNPADADPQPRTLLERAGIRVRETVASDFPAIVHTSSAVYGESGAWERDELESHLRVFPEGQLAAVDLQTSEVVGMAASLIIGWEDYEIRGTWVDFTDNGFFTNHDPAGRTLYGAGVLVRPDAQGRGVGGALYEARRMLARELKLRRIRAGARLPGYPSVADVMSPLEYARRVEAGELADPTLSFQVAQGFRVLAVVPGYLPQDRESQGYAAIIEWTVD